MKKTLLNTFALATLFFASAANAQVGVGVPAGDIHPSAELEVKSTTKGFLPPRMTNVERNAIISPATGLLIYQTDAVANNPSGLYFYDGTAWKNGLGVVGVKGDQGIPGSVGAQGIQGVKGETGAVGPQGTQGPKGETGATGSQGAAGENGAVGQKGDTGAQGPAGLTGPAGAQGAVGPKGADGQGAITIAGQGINVTGAGTVASPYVVSTTSQCGLAIGQTYQGGIIFYLDPSGCHGLISAPTNEVVGGEVWSNGLYPQYDTGNGLFEGKYNTAIITLRQGITNPAPAATMCFNSSLGGFYDWYLPSIEELNKMFQNIGQGNALGLGNIGNFLGYYWSSSDFDGGKAWLQGFGTFPGTEIIQGQDLKTNTHYVRAVRAF
jgi:hypothetical protein